MLLFHLFHVCNHVHLQAFWISLSFLDRISVKSVILMVCVDQFCKLNRLWRLLYGLLYICIYHCLLVDCPLV